MVNKKVEKLRLFREKQIKVWNLRCVEYWLEDIKESGRAYTVRLALDLLSSNWRTVKEYKEIVLNV
jgi:hypothetical protein